MAEMAEIHGEAKVAILRAIVDELREAPAPARVKDLAEAYAWLAMPGQPH